jgi:GLPGLI family protein
MKFGIFAFVAGLIILISNDSSAQQRVIAECTIEFSVSADSTSVDDAAFLASLRQSKKFIYVKGVQSRTDFINPGFTQTVIHRKDAGATILREFGQNRFMTQLSKEEWMQENKRYEGVQMVETNETRVILNYNCKKARLMLTDGQTLDVFYVPNMVPSVRDYEFQFSVVPGLVLAYESTDQQNRKVSFTARRISFSPVQATRFDIPTTGYRVLEWTAPDSKD